SKCPHLTAEFNISEFLQDGTNTLDVFVFQWSDGTYLEDQDKWRMSGLFRDVSLLSFSEKRIENITVSASLLEDYSTGTLDINVKTKALDKVNFKLFDEQGDCIFNDTAEVYDDIAHISTQFENVFKWTAETPYLYTLLVSADDQVQALKVGFRRIDISDGKLLINGVAVKLKGLNRHDTHYSLGAYSPVELMEKDVKLLKRFNMNTVRLSHYPADPKFYELCDFYGLYVIDEADIETHGVEFIDDRDLIARDVRFQKQMIDRGVRMVKRNFNHPSIIFWSLGNESGYGINHVKMAEAMRLIDSSRPIHYEQDTNAETADMYSNMYPTVEYVTKQGKTKNPKPYFMCEYIHAMGQGPGNIEDYWQAIYKYDRLIGACGWEMVDHGILRQAQDGTPYYAYGGDFNEYPHDGNFCVDAFFSPERTPHSAMIEYAHVVRPVRAKFVDEEKGKIQLHNLYNFTDLNIFNVFWSLENTGKIYASGTLNTSCAAGKKRTLTLPLGTYPKGSVIKLEFRLKKATSWAEQNFIVCSEQLESSRGFEIAVPSEPARKLTLTKEEQLYKISVGENEYIFSKNGLEKIYHLGLELTKSPFQINMFRATTDNDRGFANIAKTWENYDLVRLQQRVTAFDIKQLENKISIIIESVHAPKVYPPIVKSIQEFTVLETGELLYNLNFVPLKWNEGGINLTPNDMFRNMYVPRLGFRFSMPKEYSRVAWHGRGPHESYPDKKTAALIGYYQKEVLDMHEEYIYPQENGSHEDTKFVSVQSKSGLGLVIAGENFAFTCHDYSQENLHEAKHTYDLTRSQDTHIYIDGLMGPLGSNSCGPEPLEKDRIYLNKNFRFSFTLKPYSTQNLSTKQAANIAAKRMEP
ncbi:MAG: glycoside hydrolase family 2 TIM barrel-domain containing protein, partial [Eubacteriales bacterium]|nr:glycoside hydrolase family 2 TIM barrel-domain containing protein [Eubacteriales bacterium]